MKYTTIATKMCPRCGQITSIHEYQKGITKKEGMHTICKMCRHHLNINS